MKRVLFSLLFMTIATGALARNCVVSDPTGTPLNVRERPQGAIIGALHNGVWVRMLGVTYDAQGKPWAYIVPFAAGKRGWVFRRFLSCD